MAAWKWKIVTWGIIFLPDYCTNLVGLDDGRAAESDNHIVNYSGERAELVEIKHINTQDQNDPGGERESDDHKKKYQGDEANLG